MISEKSIILNKNNFLMLNSTIKNNIDIFYHAIFFVVTFLKKSCCIYRLMLSKKVYDLRFNLIMFTLKNQFISNKPSDGKLLSNFHGSTLFR